MCAQTAVHYCHQDHFTIAEPLLFETYTVLILSLALSFQLHNMVCSIAGASWLHSAVSFLRICNRVLSYCNIHSLKEWLCQGCLEKSVDMRIWYFLTQKKGTKALMSAMLLLSLKIPTLQISTPWQLQGLGITRSLQGKPALSMEKGFKNHKETLCMLWINPVILIDRGETPW